MWDTGATLPITVHCATKACVAQCVCERKSGSVAFTPLVFRCSVLSFDLPPPPTTTRRGGGGLFLRGGGSLLLRYLSLFTAPLRPVWPFWGEYSTYTKESQAQWPLRLWFVVARVRLKTTTTRRRTSLCLDPTNYLVFQSYLNPFCTPSGLVGSLC